MSKDKHRAHDRSMKIIANDSYKGNLHLDREGHMPSNHREIRRLIRKGLIKLDKIDAFSPWGPHIRRTVGRLLHSPWNEKR